MFITRFPDGNLERCDFRPHFDGDVVNASSAIMPRESEVATRTAALALLAEIAAWLKEHTGVFGTGGRINLVIGFSAKVKRNKRQIFKCRLPVCGLPALRGVDFSSVGGVFHEMQGWPEGLAWPSADAGAPANPDN
jgi:hypothetical protein